jgi:hypothetical protein
MVNKAITNKRQEFNFFIDDLFYLVIRHEEIKPLGNYMS